MTDYREVVAIPSNINLGLTHARQSTMMELLGRPRGRANHRCLQVTNDTLRRRMVTRSVGPFRVTGFDLAVQSLGRIMASVKENEPDLYRDLGSSGMLCVRLVRGARTALSNHSWGTAIDINIRGALDGIGVKGGTGRRDGVTLLGVAKLIPHFNAELWFSGVGFHNFEDGMHFEVSEELIHKWADEGLLPKQSSEDAGTTRQPRRTVRRGAKGGVVTRLQRALVANGYDLKPDGDFGSRTDHAVRMFQKSAGLKADGIAGPKTWEALKG